MLSATAARVVAHAGWKAFFTPASSVRCFLVGLAHSLQAGARHDALLPENRRHFFHLVGEQRAHRRPNVTLLPHHVRLRGVLVHEQQALGVALLLRGLGRGLHEGVEEGGAPLAAVLHGLLLLLSLLPLLLLALSLGLPLFGLLFRRRLLLRRTAALGQERCLLFRRLFALLRTLRLTLLLALLFLVKLLRVERVPGVRKALQVRRERVALLRVHRQVPAVNTDVRVHGVAEGRTALVRRKARAREVIDLVRELLDRDRALRDEGLLHLLLVGFRNPLVRAAILAAAESCKRPECDIRNRLGLKVEQVAHLLRPRVRPLENVRYWAAQEAPSREHNQNGRELHHGW